MNNANDKYGKVKKIKHRYLKFSRTSSLQKMHNKSFFIKEVKPNRPEEYLYPMYYLVKKLFKMHCSKSKLWLIPNHPFSHITSTKSGGILKFEVNLIKLTFFIVVLLYILAALAFLTWFQNWSSSSPNCNSESAFSHVVFHFTW